MAVERPPFASLLLRLRQAAGLTQEELATRARVGVRTVRDLEAGRATRPQRSTVDLLASALGLTGADRVRFDAAARGRPVPTVSLPRVEPLIGRDHEVAAVASLLEIADLVTIVGLTGVGKAALAVTVANEIVDRFAGGVGAVRVTPGATEAEILAAVASRLTEAPEPPSVAEGSTAPVGDGPAPLRLDPAEPALLVLINADVSPACLPAITWLRRHTEVRILATSRHPLELPGEHQWVLGPLDVPPADATAAAIVAYPAVRLFLDRLRRVRAQPVSEAEVPVLAELARWLGGLPFAIELAAARGRVLELPELLDRIRRHEDAAGPADPAGQTVRSAVLASWERLTPVEQTALCWLVMFQGRWSIDLAEQLLAACPEVADRDVVAIIDRLVCFGLVRARTHPTGGPGSPTSPNPGGAPDVGGLRLSVFDAVRRVVLQQAQARGVLTAARDQHAVVLARVCASVPTERSARDRASAETTVRTAAPGVLAHLLADIQAAADHLAATGRVPRQRGAGSDPATADELRRGLVRWLTA